MTLEFAKCVLLTDAAAAGGKMKCETGETVKREGRSRRSFVFGKIQAAPFGCGLFAWCGIFA